MVSTDDALFLVLLADIVLDNSGFELFTDLCMAELIVVRGIAARVRLHLKAMPWFVSDVTTSDFHWTLQQLAALMPELGTRWQQHLETGKWQLQPASFFWTYPCDFSAMLQVHNMFLHFKLSLFCNILCVKFTKY